MGGTFELKNGGILVSIEAPGGLYNATQLKKIAETSENHSAIVKATEDHRLSILIEDKNTFNAISSELTSVGLGVRHYMNGLHQPVSCIGAHCPKHTQDALGASLDINQELENIELNVPLKIGINGCSECCVPTHTLDISIIGDDHGYRISIGGKNSQIPEMASFIAEGVPQKELPKLIKNIVNLFKENSEEGESLKDLIERTGSSAFVECLAPYSQDAADDSDPFGSPSPEKTNTSIDLEENIDEPQSEQLDELTMEMPDESENIEELSDDVSLEENDPIEENVNINPNEFNESSSEIQDDVMINEDNTMEEPMTEETPTIEEEPMAEEMDAIEEEPMAEETAAIEEEPMAEKMDAIEEEPMVEEMDAIEEEPTAEEMDAIEEEPMAEETADIEEEPMAEEMPAIEEEPMTEEMDADQPTDLKETPKDIQSSSEQLESELEEKIGASIEEEKSLENKEMDEIHEQRTETLKLVEQELKADSNSDLSDASLEENEDMSEERLIDNNEVSEDLSPQIEQTTNQINKTPQIEGEEFSDFNVTGDKIDCSFNSGLKLSINLDAIKFAGDEKTITINSKTIQLKKTPEGIKLILDDGIEGFLPNKEAA